MAWGSFQGVSEFRANTTFFCFSDLGMFFCVHGVATQPAWLSSRLTLSSIPVVYIEAKHSGAMVILSRPLGKRILKPAPAPGPFEIGSMYP